MSSIPSKGVAGWPFAARLMVTLSALVLVTGLLILWIIRQSALNDAHAMADRLFREVTQHATDASKEQFQQVIPLIDSLTATAAQGGLPLEDDQQLVDRLLPFIRSNGDFSWISFADASGRFVGVQRISEGYGSNISHIDAAGHTHLTEAAIDANGLRRVTNVNPDSGYDPRRREFYTKALVTPDKSVWLDPYIFYGQNVPGITCAKAVVRNGKFVGVFTIDFTLDVLQKELAKLRVSEHSNLCIFTDRGRLIASQRAGAINSTTLPTVAEADPMMAALLRQADATGRPFDLNWDGNKYFATALPYEVGAGQNWIVGVVAPADDFLANTYRSQRAAALACGVAMVAALALAATLAKRVSRPVLEITGLMQRIGEGDLDAKADVRGAREFRQLSASLAQMVGELRSGLRLRHSIAVAMQVQQRLLPQNPPKIPGLDIAGHSKYCDETGGDYYDFLPAQQLGPDKLMIVIGDVTGHGVGAALLMASVRAVLRDRCCEPVSLGELLGRLNQILCRDSDYEYFMTMQIAIIDTEGGRYTFANAGHDASIIYRPATGSFDEVQKGGVPLGVLEETTYEDYPVTGLCEGDVVVFGTDGVWEMRAVSTEMFGKDRLRDVMRQNAGKTAAEIRDAIDSALVQFRGDLPVEDDVTFVVVKRVRSVA